MAINLKINKTSCDFFRYRFYDKLFPAYNLQDVSKGHQPCMYTIVGDIHTTHLTPTQRYA